ncbi:MAG: hypothetical protein KAK00_08955 [Nanoarchaeota archaeon]|nr:hypothetical protein [Nanoarchaeota archaeon]
MNQKNHRIIGAIGVPLVLLALQAKIGLSLNLSTGILLIAAAIVGYVFGGGLLSPDIDHGFYHRNFITHSTLIPYFFVAATSKISYLYSLLVMVFIAWTLHVFVDFFSEEDKFALDIDTSKWAGGKVSYILSWVILLGTWIALFTITPFGLFIP